MRTSYFLRFACILFFILAQARGIRGQTLSNADELQKLVDADRFEALLDYHSKNPTVKWPKIYSAEFCEERLKGKEQVEALQARKLTEVVFNKLKLYQSELKKMPLDEFEKSIDALLNLRDKLAQPAYGNMVLQLCIERTVTLRIAERVVKSSDNVKALGKFAQRKNDWAGQWRVLCQMIEEEEGQKSFDYEAMEKMSKREIMAGRKLYPPATLAKMSEQERSKAIAKNPKVLFGRYDEDAVLNSRRLPTFHELLVKRDFNILFHFVFLEDYDGQIILPGLLLFKQRGGNFGNGWTNDFDKRMGDYADRAEFADYALDSDRFKGLVEIANDPDANSSEAFMFETFSLFQK